MNFVHPFAGLAALLAAGIIAFILFRARANRTKGALVYSNLDFLIAAMRPNPWVERMFLGAFCSGLAFLTLSVAYPYCTIVAPRHGIEIAICIDTSGSMSSTDIDPTRARAVIASVQLFLSRLPGDASVELIAFASSARIIQSFTTDRAELEDALQRIPSPNGATAIGDAFALARETITATSGDVVLLTDGVNNTGSDPLVEARALASRGIHIWAVGIGKTHGDMMPGTFERATIDPDALRTYARIGHGMFHAAASAGMMRAMLSDLSRKVAYLSAPLDMSYAFSTLGVTLIIATTVTAIACGRIP